MDMQLFYTQIQKTYQRWRQDTLVGKEMS